MSFYREVFARIKIKAEFLEDFRHLYNEEYSEITNPLFKEFVEEHYSEETRKYLGEVNWRSYSVPIKNLLNSSPDPLEGDILEYHLSYKYNRFYIEEDFENLIYEIKEKAFEIYWYDEMGGGADGNPYFNYLETDAIKMEPDAYNVFSIISDKVDNGDVCGDEESIEINGLSIKLDMPDLKKWTSEYLWQVLVPCESGETTIEEINKTFDWKDFHERGLKLAYKVRELLPKNVRLRYASPFEDRSGIIDDEKWIE